MRRYGYLITASLLLLLACGREQDEGRIFADNCATCHGARGEGRPELGAPALAGLPAWYVEAQLRNFREGRRGYHPDDLEGQRMRPMSRLLQQGQELTRVAAHVGKLPVQVGGAVVDGDPARGRELYTTCAACHGQEGEGQEATGAPPLGQAGDEYLLRQLRKFRNGQRGTAPGDTRGAQMRAMALALPDEQALADVVAYLHGLGDQRRAGRTP